MTASSSNLVHDASSKPQPRPARVVGTTQISEEALARMAGELLREIPGVESLVPTGVNQAVTSLVRRARGQLMRKLGIDVEVGLEEVAFDLRIVIRYPENINEVADAIREVLRREIPRQTGLRVVETNIEVVDVHFDADAAPGSDRARVR